MPVTERPDDLESTSADGEPGELTGPPLRRAMTLITVAWMFGAVWMHALGGAPLTIFATNLGASNFEFGLLAALPFVAALLSLPASLLIERSGQRKIIFLVTLYVNRLMWFPIGIVPLWVVHHYGAQYQPVAIFAFLSLTFIMHAGQAIGGPAWITWMADVVPDRLRGRYFARRRQWGILTAIPAALIAGWTIDYYHTQYLGQANGQQAMLVVCAAIFCASAMFGAADIFLFHFVPHKRPPKRRQPLGLILLRPLQNKRFALFSLSTAVLWFAVAAQGQFVNKYLYDYLHITSTRVQLIVLVCPLLAQLVVLPIWGRSIDRFGKRPSMLIAIVGLIPVGIGWCLMSEGHVWLGYVLAVAGAACWTGVEVANLNLVLELSGSDDTGQTGGSAYMAVNSLIINIAGCLGGLFYGSVAEWIGEGGLSLAYIGLPHVTYYEVIFGLSAALRLAAVLVLLLVHEPEARPTVDVLRFMAGNLYNNIVGTVMLPVRLVRRDAAQEP